MPYKYFIRYNHQIFRWFKLYQCDSSNTICCIFRGFTYNQILSPMLYFRGIYIAPYRYWSNWNYEVLNHKREFQGFSLGRSQKHKEFWIVESYRVFLPPRWSALVLWMNGKNMWFRLSKLWAISEVWNNDGSGTSSLSLEETHSSSWWRGHSFMVDVWE